MAEEPKWFRADETAKLMEEVVQYEKIIKDNKNKKKDNKQLKKEDEKQFQVSCDSKFYKKYQDKLRKWWDYYYNRKSRSSELRQTQGQPGEFQEPWPASRFLAFLLYVGKTQANIKLDEVETSLGIRHLIIKKMKMEKSKWTKN